MNINCCSSQLGNTGVSPCDKPFGTKYRSILVNITANDGVKNSIELDINGQVTEADVTALINQSDKSKRWYPLPETHDPESERAEPITQEDNLGNTRVVRDAARSVTEVFWYVTKSTLKNLRRFERAKVGVYYVDNAGNLMGLVSGSKLLPIPIQSLNFRDMDNDGQTGYQIMMTYQFKMNVGDEDLAYIGYESILTDLTTVSGLLDVVGTVVATPSLVTVTLYVQGNNIANKICVEGLVVGDFSFANVTQANTLTLSTLSETSTGVYEITVSANNPNVGDDLTATITKSGYDFTFINDIEIEVVS